LSSTDGSLILFCGVLQPRNTLLTDTCLRRYKDKIKYNSRTCCHLNVSPREGRVAYNLYFMRRGALNAGAGGKFVTQGS
jgi:hypothetical protein